MKDGGQGILMGFDGRIGGIDIGSMWVKHKNNSNRYFCFIILSSIWQTFQYSREVCNTTTQARTVETMFAVETMQMRGSLPGSRDRTVIPMSLPPTHHGSPSSGYLETQVCLTALSLSGFSPSCPGAWPFTTGSSRAPSISITRVLRSG